MYHELKMEKVPAGCLRVGATLGDGRVLRVDRNAGRVLVQLAAIPSQEEIDLMASHDEGQGDDAFRGTFEGENPTSEVLRLLNYGNTLHAQMDQIRFPHAGAAKLQRFGAGFSAVRRVRLSKFSLKRLQSKRAPQQPQNQQQQQQQRRP